MKGFSLAFSIHASTFLWRMSQFHLTFISLYITITTLWELHVSLFIIWHYWSRTGYQIHGDKTRSTYGRDEEGKKKIALKIWRDRPLWRPRQMEKVTL